jgi:hypothetical protein
VLGPLVLAAPLGQLVLAAPLGPLVLAARRKNELLIG